MNRWLIYVPEINPGSFVFFYFKGASGRSWSIREYLGPAPSVRYAKDFPAAWTPEVVLDMADREGCFAVSAPTVDTNDIGYWREHIAGSESGAPRRRSRPRSRQRPRPRAPSCLCSPSWTATCC